MSQLESPARISATSADASLEAVRLRELICQAARTACVNSFGNALTAIVLTGSVARDEGSFVWEGDSWSLYGDVEFIVVFEKRASMPSAATLSAICRQIEDHLKEHRHIHCRVDLSAVGPGYLRGLPPHIFSYELKQCGNVIWGDSRILQSIPNFSASDLSREDAWRLLCNRLIELLAFFESPSLVSREPTLSLQYATLKLYLDTATSYLVFAGAYEPTYRHRAEKLRSLAEQQHALDGSFQFSLADLSARVSESTERKLSGDFARPGRPAQSLADAIRFAQAVWKWEAARLTGASADKSTAALFDRLSAQLKFTARIRGWASVAKRDGGLKSWPSWPRWARLTFRTSPRYAVYRAGVQLAFRLPELLGDCKGEVISNGELSALCSQLPAGETYAPRADWHSTANAVLRNYKEFVVTTVA